MDERDARDLRRTALLMRQARMSVRGARGTSADAGEVSEERRASLPREPPRGGASSQDKFRSLVGLAKKHKTGVGRPCTGERLVELAEYFCSLAEPGRPDESAVAPMRRRIAELEKRLSESEARAVEAEQEYLDQKKRTDGLWKAAVQSAIKLGKAGSSMTEMRHTKDQAFVSAQVEIVEAGRRSRQEMDDLRAIMEAQERWLRNNWYEARDENDWLRREVDRLRLQLAQEEQVTTDQRVLEAEEVRDGALSEMHCLEDMLEDERRQYAAAIAWAQERYTVEMNRNISLDQEARVAKEAMKKLREERDNAQDEILSLQDELQAVRTQRDAAWSQFRTAERQAYEKGFDHCRQVVATVVPEQTLRQFAVPISVRASEASSSDPAGGEPVDKAP